MTDADLVSETVNEAVNSGFSSVPIINIQPLVSDDCTLQQRLAVAAQIRQACRECGFFYVVGHGVDEGLQQRLEQLSRQFFAQDLETKLQIRMALGGKAWRGYFPVGDELTSGTPDLKEGIYFGAELAEDHPLVQAPLHGRNLFPDNLPLRQTVLDYMAAMTQLGHQLMAGIALSLGLEESYFADRYTADPLILFRIFNYPPHPLSADGASWGVGEHTDYGVLTILKQDDCGGLQVKSRSGWIAAPPVPNSFVCNIGDMLDRMTKGLYRSTPHRVQNLAQHDRLSFPFFFDPNFNVEVQPIELCRSKLFEWERQSISDSINQTEQSGAAGLGGEVPEDDKNERWDRASVHEFRGTYGDYVLSKVSKVFPQLRQEVL